MIGPSVVMSRSVFGVYKSSLSSPFALSTFLTPFQQIFKLLPAQDSETAIAIDDVSHIPLASSTVPFGTVASLNEMPFDKHSSVPYLTSLVCRGYRAVVGLGLLGCPPQLRSECRRSQRVYRTQMEESECCIFPWLG
jgi:hypothetical protein